MIRPRGDWVVTAPVPRPHGAIALTGLVPATGKVLAVGPAVEGVLPGQLVYYGPRCGEPVEHEFQRLLMLRQEEILGVTNA
jgi:hypothetical protein